MPKAKKRLSGKFKPLDKPINLPAKPTPPTLLDEAENEYSRTSFDEKNRRWESECSAIYAEESLNKLQLLLDYYEIKDTSESKWMLLCLSMGKDFFPGFLTTTENKAPGKKKKWNDFRLLYLYAQVSAVKKEKGDSISIDQACRFLSKREQWRNLEWKTLKNQYHNAEKSDLVLWAVEKCSPFGESATEKLCEIAEFFKDATPI